MKLVTKIRVGSGFEHKKGQHSRIKKKKQAGRRDYCDRTLLIMIIVIYYFCFLSFKVTFNHGLWAKNTMYYVSPLNHFLVINELSFIFILIITPRSKAHLKLTL